MCGILGICSLEGRPVSPSRVRAGLDTLRRRGPDDEGYVLIDTRTGSAMAAGGPDTPEAVFRLPFASTPSRRIDDVEAGADLVLAARRLAIQDLSPAGHQPFASDDARVWVVYNGEVYNFGELRQELEAAGHAFRSHSDTEVVLRAYEEWGADFLHRLNGMWAIALWDARAGRLLCARDRFGVKPFYYRHTADRFVFGSELKALLATGLVEAFPNDQVIAAYLAEGRVDDTDDTFFAGVQVLPPGHVLEIVPESGSLNIAQWYRLPLGARLDGIGAAEHVERFYDLFEDAVRLRLISDVPVGSCLSGGIDSSSIVCVVDRLLRDHRAVAGSAGAQATFSARYDDPRHDEGRYIDAVVAATDASPYAVRPTGDDLLHRVDELVDVQDEPFPSTSIYAQWEVYRLARARGVVVTLDGQGGDETLGGYPHQLSARLNSLFLSGRVAAWLAESGEQAEAGGTDIARFRAMSAASAVASLAPAGVRTWNHRRIAARDRPAWLNADLVASEAARPTRDRLTAQLARDLTGGLRGLLRFADRNSMAHSVENRLPFLDYRLVEHAFALPGDHRIRGTETKVLLRQAMRGVVPDVVLDRRDKIGFSTPQDRWFRESLAPLARDVLGSPSFRARPWVDQAALSPLLLQHERGEADHSGALWRCVNLELWLRRYLDA